MKSKYAHFGPFLRIFLRTFLNFFMRILVIIRDYHPKPTPFDKAWAWMASSPSDDEEE